MEESLINKPHADAAGELLPLLDAWPDGRRMAILTGAGISTDAGIPDYRDAEGNWKHTRPVMYADFMASLAVRQRYWARTTVGWPRMAHAEPAAAHCFLKQLQDEGHVTRLITQNVDGLHQKAGSSEVIDLHGRLDEVRCQRCAALTPRAHWQQIITELNHAWLDAVGVVQEAPDGDAQIERGDFDRFVVPDCPRCGGIVKPEVVFFGENVPRERVEEAYRAVEDADGLVVIGSSLMVFSGFRFARRCHEAGKPLFIINLGKTRADELATQTIRRPAGETLAAVCEAKGCN